MKLELKKNTKEFYYCKTENPVIEWSIVQVSEDKWEIVGLQFKENEKGQMESDGIPYLIEANSLDDAEQAIIDVVTQLRNL